MDGAAGTFSAQASPAGRGRLASSPDTAAHTPTPPNRHSDQTSAARFQPAVPPAASVRTTAHRCDWLEQIPLSVLLHAMRLLSSAPGLEGELA
jgi:hypothetical protein